jgi:hypothetical protein
LCVMDDLGFCRLSVANDLQIAMETHSPNPLGTNSMTDSKKVLNLLCKVLRCVHCVKMLIYLARS